MAVSAHTTQQRVYFGGVLFLALTIGFFFIPPDIFFTFGVGLTALTFFCLFLFNLRFGLYALAAVGFFNGWDLILAKYSWAKQIAYLSSVNAPVVDFLAVVLGFSILVSYGIKILPFSRAEFKTTLRPMRWYALFILVSGGATILAYEHQMFSSVKYLLRSMLFVFPAYVLIPAALITSKDVLLKIFKIWLGVGVITALFGLSSLVVVPQAGWIRVEPYKIGDFAPLGYNHNLIAEVLTAIIPVAAYLVFRERFKRVQGPQTTRRWMGFALALGLIIAIDLLTLSRAGWLAFMVELGVIAYFFHHQLLEYFRFKARHGSQFVLLIAVLALIGYMGLFLTSATVSSSNQTRWQLTDITLFYTLRSPLHGYGPGMFTRLLGDTFDYVIEHGEVLDSHGFIQKILLEEGFVGLALFVIFLIIVFAELFKVESPVAEDGLLIPLMITMLAGVFAFQMFNTSYFSSVMWLPIGVALAAAKLSKHH